MSALAVPGVDFDVLRDSRHRRARAAREQRDWLTWLELGGLRPRTLDSYERSTAVALRMFPTRDFADFTDGDLLHVFKTFPAKSRRVRVAAYRSWFRWGLQTRRITANPMLMLPDIRQPPARQIEVFSDTEMHTLEALPSPDGPLMSVLFRAGLRKGEARKLKERHCDLIRQRITVLDGKGGKDRTIPISDRLTVILDELFTVEGISRDEHLWYCRPGGHKVTRDRPIGEGTFAVWWRRCIADADITYRNPHTTRHTYATRWLRNGGRLETLSRAMGHTSIRTTHDLYNHLASDDIAADVAIVDASGE